MTSGQPRTSSTATSVDGTVLHVEIRGEPTSPPVVLLHGWAQSGACWDGVAGALAAQHHVVVPDLRGHGRSDAPEVGYDDPNVWAGDLDAVLRAAGVTAAPVLVGWSYGGLVACDWLRAGGRAGGLVLVGAVTGLGRGRAGGRVGPAMRAAAADATSTDLATALAALSAFCSTLAPDTDSVQALLGAALVTPPRVRAALFARECDSDDVLASFTAPALVLHGDADPVVDVRAGRHAAGLLADVRTSEWAGGGHAPFLEDPARFVGEVSAFAAHARGVAGRMGG